MSKAKLTTMRQKKIYRYTFDVRYAGRGSILLHTLLINPEEMSQDEPARSGVTQTLGGAYVTDFGSGLPTVDISGTTGYGRRTSAEGKDVDGYEEFLNFRNRVYRDFVQNPDPNLSMYWYNWEDDEYYEIQPQSFRLQRSKSATLLYRYSFHFTCIRRLTDTQGAIALDYLHSNPATNTLAVDVQTSISALGEYLHTLTGKVGAYHV